MPLYSLELRLLAALVTASPALPVPCLPPPQVEVFDLKVIIPLLAEVSQVSRKDLAVGGLTIENAHDKVHFLYYMVCTPAFLQW